MGRGDFPLRALPRAFVAGIPDPAPAALDLPDEEWHKFRNVLRLSTGDEVCVLPGDGRALRCEMDGRQAIVHDAIRPDTDARPVTLGLGLPKPDALESSIRMASEIGIARFLIFPTERTVIKWDEKKRAKRHARLETIAREASEVCFRTRLPMIEWADSLESVLTRLPKAVVLSEQDDVPRPMPRDADAYLIGPEGGWAPREVELIGDRAATLGPRVFRVDTAVAATASLALCA